MNIYNFATKRKKERTKRKFMERLAKTGLTCVMATTAFPGTIKAQEKITASLEADLVSEYVWRGLRMEGVSIQPSVTVAYKGISLNVWGTTGLSRNGVKEVNLELGYTTGGLSVSVVDQWADEGCGYFHYGARNTNHVFEARAEYDFGVLTASWATNFAGADGRPASDKRAYSSYLNVSAPFRLGGLEWEAGIGVTPWGTNYYNYTSDGREGARGFEVCDISLKTSKELKITSSFSIPISAEAIWNPATEHAYFVVGLNF